MTAPSSAPAAPPSTLPCPVCSAPSPSTGPIFHPSPALVAGVPIDLSALAPFVLRTCPSCGFCFKTPTIPESKLLECYSKADAGNWEVDPDPMHRQFDVLKDVVRNISAGITGRKPRVLDVGCFNGAMLKFFGDDFEPFGVEPSVDAAKLAQTRGINILGPTIDAVQGHDNFFDVILAIDVVEHVVDPRSFFTSVSRLLRPGPNGGSFVILTGDTDTWPFRLQGSRHWYVSLLPEHVSFYNQSSLNALAKLTGMSSVQHRVLSHARTSAALKVRQGVANLVFAALWKTGGLGLPPLRSKFCSRMAPLWISSADHLLHVMSRS